MHSFWHSYYLLIFLIVPNGCQQPVEEKTKSLQQSLSGLTFESGKPEYLSTPFVAAGDRVYLVGHQDGSFPPLGWHVKGEMGGIWDHPIKLLAGFDASLSLNEDVKGFCLDQADAFTNYPMGNTHHFSWHEENIEVERFQFVPDGAEGVVVEFLIRNKGNRQRKFIFSFNSHFNLRPTWLGERTGMKDDEDEVLFLANEKVLLARDKSNPWFAVVGSSREPATYSFENVVCSKVTPVQGKGATLTYQLTVDPGKETVIPFYIAGSYHSRSEALATYFSINRNAGANLVHKIARYDSIKKTAIVEVPDTTLQRMLEWTRYSTDWLIREVPEIGRGLSAGTPDYPWWFGCDSEYALQGVLATGQHGLVKSSILLLKKISNKTNGNGRIIHEASTNGAVYNRGNTNETAQFISLLWQYYEWTGDRDLIIQLYPDVKKGMHWLLTDMDPDQNLFPNGAGMVEIAGLDSEMIDVAVYTQQALEAASHLSDVMNEHEWQKTFWKKSVKLKKLINDAWWVEEDNSYADFISTPAKALSLIEAALVRADTLNKKSAVTELGIKLKRLKSSSNRVPKGYTVFHNAVVNSPMEVGVAEPEKARRALLTARNYRNYFGAYVTGIDKGEEEVDSLVQKSRKKTFNYTGAVMTLPTGVLAIAEARYGNSDEALEYLRRLGHSFSYALPGSLYEVSPDFGMIAQAWNIYAVAVPVISHFFGVHPSAATKTVTFHPSLPRDWKQASLKNLPVGANRVSIVIEVKDKVTTYTLTQTLSDWALKLQVDSKTTIRVNQKNVSPVATDQGTFIILSQGKEFVVEVSDGG